MVPTDLRVTGWFQGKSKVPSSKGYSKGLRLILMLILMVQGQPHAFIMGSKATLRINGYKIPHRFEGFQWNQGPPHGFGASQQVIGLTHVFESYPQGIPNEPDSRIIHKRIILKPRSIPRVWEVPESLRLPKGWKGYSKKGYPQGPEGTMLVQRLLQGIDGY